MSTQTCWHSCFNLFCRYMLLKMMFGSYVPTSDTGNIIAGGMSGEWCLDVTYWLLSMTLICSDVTRRQEITNFLMTSYQYNNLTPWITFAYLHFFVLHSFYYPCTRQTMTAPGPKPQRHFMPATWNADSGSEICDEPPVTSSIIPN